MAMLRIWAVDASCPGANASNAQPAGLLVLQRICRPSKIITTMILRQHPQPTRLSLGIPRTVEQPDHASACLFPPPNIRQPLDDASPQARRCRQDPPYRGPPEGRYSAICDTFTHMGWRRSCLR
ncbi:hypothetical protein B0H63DRAFT_562741 [Podospora didyma]|uniref:Uncharacterized protein n=1 Tax=Podospora didyma TaxID=330526 RepID=A0AAE0KDH5_9PEZI|nr:hypothetical protein B0H63DRAFT_562741 [Podospora didyma]